MIVVDASAALALLRSEAGADVVAAHMAHGKISAVNAIEVVERLARGGLPFDEAREAFATLRFSVEALTVERAIRAAGLLARHRRAGLSLADCACIALAAEHDLPVLTGDRIWTTLDLPVKVELIR